MTLIRLFVSILFVLIGCSVSGQSTFDFYKSRKYYNKAQLASYQKDYKAEKKYYEETFKYANKNHVVSMYYDSYITCLLNNKDTLAAIDAEAKYLALGLINMVSNNSLLRQFGNKYGNELIKRLPEIKNEYENLPDKENRLAIEELQKKDQEIRNDRNTMARGEWNKTLVLVDSLNFYTLYQLVKYKNADPLCFLMYHLYGSNQKYFAFYDSIYKVKIYKGEASPEAYVQWYDRQRMYVDKMKTQLFGEWNDIEDKGNEFNPIEDIQHVDKRRASFGLPSLADYAMLHSMILPKDYPRSK